MLHLNVTAACQALHISRPTYYRKVASGAILPQRDGLGRVYVTQAEVDRLLGADSCTGQLSKK